MSEFVMVDIVAATGIRILGVDYKTNRNNLFIGATSIDFGMLLSSMNAIWQGVKDNKPQSTLD